MSLKRLDQRLLKKLAEKVGKPEQYVREQISKRASRYGISSEAAQVLWAKEFDLGTATFQRSLAPHLQEQIRTGLPSIFVKQTSVSSQKAPVKTRAKQTKLKVLRLAIDYLIIDEELKKRCSDLLMAKGNFDRVFREATTVLDDRLRKIGNIKSKMKPIDVIGKVLNPNPQTAILKVSDDAEEQEGFFNICKGLFLAFRNPTHHQLTDKFTREDAVRFCGFVDALLAVLNQANQSSGPKRT